MNMDTTPLTEKQKAVHGFISTYYRVNGVPPSMATISRHFGWSSPTSAMQHVARLTDKGMARKTPRGYIPVGSLEPVE